MRTVFYNNILSPHQLPQDRALREAVGERHHLYLYRDPLPEDRRAMGWTRSLPEAQCRQCPDGNAAELFQADALFLGIRDWELLDWRLEHDQVTYYISERWLLPRWGMLRLLSPRWFRMAWHLSRRFHDPNFLYWAQGIHAARDMYRLLRLFRGDLTMLFRTPALAFEPIPGGAILPLNEAVSAGLLSPEVTAYAREHGFAALPENAWGHLPISGLTANMRCFGYFPEADPPGTAAPAERPSEPSPERPRRLLWVGRMLRWKRVDVLVKAVRHCLKHGVPLELDVYGEGPERRRLEKLANHCPAIRFHDFVSAEEVRRQMREHDLYVLTSDGTEGWGAVINEALTAGLPVLATPESGAGATLLPRTCLVPAGDWRLLARALTAPLPELPTTLLPRWTANLGADALLKATIGR